MCDIAHICHLVAAKIRENHIELDRETHHDLCPQAFVRLSIIRVSTLKLPIWAAEGDNYIRTFAGGECSIYAVGPKWFCLSYKLEQNDACDLHGTYEVCSPSSFHAKIISWRETLSTISRKEKKDDRRRYIILGNKEEEGESWVRQPN
ncbi:hypothetical protein OPV22_019625 [Ensete ventricosum]|uniref:Uncharacterized protein n=1 Tax=Ensete ventricosum TaxID=4639 RepID=A0AAV8QIA0_ENSVE|nr:hypothetical protein OPV22_019625 [Ensete ventricosum]